MKILLNGVQKHGTLFVMKKEILSSYAAGPGHHKKPILFYGIGINRKGSYFLKLKWEPLLEILSYPF